MRCFFLLLIIGLLTGCDHKLDPTLPGDTNPVAISSLDRVYTADQSSNTVSVIDPSTDKLLGQIKFGNGRPDHLSPLYNHEVNVHGLGVSPDSRYLAVVSTLTNSVSFVDLMTNLVSMKTYVGRNPHEGFFSPDGKQYWLAVRGENYVSVIDMSTQQEIRRVVTANGPSMVVFRPDGLVAFVNHSFTAEIDVVDTKTYQVIKRVPVVSPFSPNLAATFDGNQVWFTHKDIGKVSVLNARTYDIEGVIDTGPGTNHVNFAGPDGGTRYSGSAAGAFAYVTVGGENAVKVYSRDRQLVATIPTGPNPHGVWPSGDGSKVYVGLENGDAVDVIDTKTNTRRTEIASGQAPQALIYVAKAVPPPATGLTNLVPLASGPPLNVRLSPVGTQPVPGVGGGVTLRTIDGVDEAILMLKKLAPTTTYTLYLSDQRTVAVNPEAVLSFTTDDQGAVETYAYYQIKLRLTGRYMLVLQGDKNPAAPVVLSTP